MRAPNCDPRMPKLFQSKNHWGRLGAWLIHVAPKSSLASAPDALSLAFRAGDRHAGTHHVVASALACPLVMKTKD